MKIIYFILYFNILLSTELPKGFTPQEWLNRHTIEDMSRSTDPPEGPVRNIAEYERMQGMLIRYPLGLTTAIIREIAEDITVYCLVSNSQQNAAFNTLNNADVNMNNVEFILGSTDSYWTRDYGPWWVVDGNKNVGVVDFTYNRPRPNDNNAPYKLSEYLSTPYFSADVIHCGGNYMTDGYGTSASTTLVYEENSISINALDQIMFDYYGVSQYDVVDDPNNEYIDHIDCWGKYLSPSKLLIREVAQSHPQYDEIENVVDYFENQLNSFGEPWEIFRVYTQNDQPYTNSTIINDKVLVPITGSSWDDDALEVYQNALPGYEILGFTGNWFSTDALHCRTKGIPDLNMLQIFHNPINDQILPQNDYEVLATIDDLSDEGLIVEELYIGWKNSEMNDYEIIYFTPGNNTDEYIANIPNQINDTEIHYFLHAVDNTGREEYLPMAGYYSFSAIGGMPTQQGDINLDSTINVLDIVLMVNYILNVAELTDYQLEIGDLNSDTIVNILDIITLVNIILEG
ncbi:MAG: peptidylarginine deiminase [Candidatus Marinimicrobia bacterium]|nr:peptidylarginine deiminase [Candidatus Neomarinimicrobiota bacterium]|tara:strand:- start:1468 stop:3012 length:1545 start_codon:yes stop_codon:yes gene_type:complete